MRIGDCLSAQDLKIIVCQKEYKQKYFTMQFCHSPICFQLQIRVDIVWNHFQHRAISFLF